MNPKGFHSPDLVIVSQGKGHKKGYKMVEVSGACEHEWYERTWLKYLRRIFNEQVLAMQDGQTSGLKDKDNRLDRSICYYKDEKQPIAAAQLPTFPSPVMSRTSEFRL